MRLFHWQIWRLNSLGMGRGRDGLQGFGNFLRCHSCSWSSTSGQNFTCSASLLVVYVWMREGDYHYKSPWWCLWKMFMGKVLVVYYFCVHLEEGWDIICLRDDICWHLTPSCPFGLQAQPRPLAPQKEWDQLRCRPACRCPCLVAVIGVVWGWERSLVLFTGTVSGSSPAHVGSPWLLCGIFYLTTNKVVGRLSPRARQCQVPIRAWTWFQNTGKKQFYDSDKLGCVY